MTPDCWNIGGLFAESLILLEIILLAESGLGFLVLVGEIGLEARAEIDVPTPKATHERFRVLIVMCS